MDSVYDKDYLVVDKKSCEFYSLDSEPCLHYSMTTNVPYVWQGWCEKATGLSETELCLIVSRFINSSLFYHKL